MQRIFYSTTVLAIVFALTIAAHATLWDRGGGLIYDDVLNVTWLQDANYANTTGYDDSLYGFDTGGRMRWPDAVYWAANLTYYDSVRGVTYDDWRLPHTLPVNGSSYKDDPILNKFYTDGSTDLSWNISAPGSAYPGSTGSELAYMFYANLVNKGYYDVNGKIQQVHGLVNTGPFINLQAYVYWSGTEFSSDYAFDFTFVDPFYGGWLDGFQGYEHKYSIGYNAWAVRDGDVAAVPEPSTMLFLVSSLICVGWTGRKFKRYIVG